MWNFAKDAIMYILVISGFRDVFNSFSFFYLKFLPIAVECNKTKGTLVHERERLTLLMVCFEYRV